MCTSSEFMLNLIFVSIKFPNVVLYLESLSGISGMLRKGVGNMSVLIFQETCYLWGIWGKRMY